MLSTKSLPVPREYSKKSLSRSPLALYRRAFQCGHFLSKWDDHLLWVNAGSNKASCAPSACQGHPLVLDQGAIVPWNPWHVRVHALSGLVHVRWATEPQLLLPQFTVLITAGLHSWHTWAVWQFPTGGIPASLSAVMKVVVQPTATSKPSQSTRPSTPSVLTPLSSRDVGARP